MAQLSSPRQENQRNANSATMLRAVDTFMGTQQQSYDDFMGGFLFLTKDDIKHTIKKEHLQSLHHKLEKSSKEQQPLDIQSTCMDKKPVKSDNEVEEEVLEAGVRCGVMANKEEMKTIVTFDNFVVEEEDISEEDLADLPPLACYQSSFGSSSKNKDETLKNKAPVTYNPEDKKVPADAREENDDVDAVSTPDFSDAHAPNTDGTTINPGEIDPAEDDLNSGSVTCKNTQLDYCGNSQTEVNSKLNDDADDECSNEVHAFTLDEDFDYDNVTLTPKFTDEEMCFLRSCMANNKEEQIS